MLCASSAFLCAADVPKAQPAISDSDAQEIIRILREKRWPQARDLNRSKLRVLLAEADSGLAVVPKGAAVAASALHLEKLPRKPAIGYCRFNGAPSGADATRLEQQLSEWQRDGVAGLILDLRDTNNFADYAALVRFVSLFVKEPAPLFMIETGSTEPVQRYQATGKPLTMPSPVVILINRRTAGVGEVLAEMLRQHAQALLMGQPTAGQRRFALDLRLADGALLRISTGRVLIADPNIEPSRHSLPPEQPIAPDVVVEGTSALVLDQLLKTNPKAATALTRESKARARLSEASLVRQENPETDNWLVGDASPTDTPGNALAAVQKEKSAETSQDAALIRACDIVQARHALAQPPQIAASTGKSAEPSGN